MSKLNHSNIKRNKVRNFWQPSSYPVEMPKCFLDVWAIMAPPCSKQNTRCLLSGNGAIVIQGIFKMINDCYREGFSQIFSTLVILVSSKRLLVLALYLTEKSILIASFIKLIAKSAFLKIFDNQITKMGVDETMVHTELGSI